MNKTLIALPICWAAIIAESITEQTPISLGLFLAGIVGTVLLVWRARGEREKIAHRLDAIETRCKYVTERVEKLEKKK